MKTRPIRGISRRRFVASAGAALAGLGMARRVSGQVSGTTLAATRLSDTVIAIAGAGTNILVVSSPDGLLMVDGGLPGSSGAVLKLVGEQAGSGPIRTLFNTNWYPEHTGSNAVLAGTGTRIIAHENTRLWLGAEIEVEWQNRTYPPMPAAAQPTETFYTTGMLQFGNQEVRYGYLPQAHTDGDIYVFFPAQNLLVVSDVLAVDSYPIPDYVTGGWIGGMAEANRVLLEMTDAQTRIVPAQGPLQTRADLQAHFDMCIAIKDLTAEAYRKSLSVEEFIATKPTAPYDAQRGDPELFLRLAYEGVWNHIREIGKVV